MRNILECRVLSISRQLPVLLTQNPRFPEEGLDFASESLVFFSMGYAHRESSGNYPSLHLLIVLPELLTTYSLPFPLYPVRERLLILGVQPPNETFHGVHLFFSPWIRFSIRDQSSFQFSDIVDNFAGSLGFVAYWTRPFPFSRFRRTYSSCLVLDYQRVLLPFSILFSTAPPSLEPRSLPDSHQHFTSNSFCNAASPRFCPFHNFLLNYYS